MRKVTVFLLIMLFTTMAFAGNAKVVSKNITTKAKKVIVKKVEVKKPVAVTKNVEVKAKKVVKKVDTKKK